MGFGELVLILFLVLLFFGAGKLSALGDGLGKALRGLKDAMKTGTPGPPPAQPEPKKELPPQP